MSTALSNDSFLWNKLLSNNSYLDDEGLIVRNRIKQAARWGEKAKYAIDIGAGQGFLETRLSELIANNAINWFAFDISQIGLDRLKKVHPKIQTTLGSILNLPFRDGVFDVIYAMEILEHLHPSIVHRAYVNLRRVLSDRGKMVISVPVYERVSLVEHPVGHFRKHTPATIEREIANNGFRIIDKRYLYAFNDFYSIKSWVAEVTGLRRPNVVMYLCLKS